jgi:molybdate transport system regulatory protein
MARVSFRIVFEDRTALGPGKIELLERIAELGSISAAGRVFGMSYRRAWTLVDELNNMFTSPLVRAAPGGTGGGGARLTALGERIVREYRALETTIHANVADSLAALDADKRVG